MTSKIKTPNFADFKITPKTAQLK